MIQKFDTVESAFNCAELAHWFEISCKLYKECGFWFVKF